MKIKINDKVKILNGKDKGKTGKVIQVFSDQEKIVVEGVNVMKKHLRAGKQGERGQVIELAGPVHQSKAGLVCPKCEAVIRVGYKLEANEKKRVCRKCQQFID